MLVLSFFKKILNIIFPFSCRVLVWLHCSCFKLGSIFFCRIVSGKRLNLKLFSQILRCYLKDHCPNTPLIALFMLNPILVMKFGFKFLWKITTFWPFLYTWHLRASNGPLDNQVVSYIEFLVEQRTDLHTSQLISWSMIPTKMFSFNNIHF